MDDIERMLLIMDLEEDWSECQQDKEKEYKPPDWFLIGMGIKEAPEHVKFKAKEIYKEFLRFKGSKENSFEELVKSFTLAKAQNKTGV